MTQDEPSSHTSRRSYLILGGAIILSVLVGLGIGMAFAGEAEAEPEIDIPIAVQEIHNDWFDAWSDADGKAVLSMMAPGGRHYCLGSGIDGVSGEELAAFVDKGFSVSDLEIIGSISMPTPGEGQSQDHVVVSQHTLDGHEGYISTLHLRGQEDSLKILSHRAFP